MNLILLTKSLRKILTCHLSMKVCQNVEYPTRALAPDSLFWSGPGTKKLPDSLCTPSGNINIKAVTDELYTAHPWNGVEEGRYFDMAKMKLSRNYSGVSQSPRGRAGSSHSSHQTGSNITDTLSDKFLVAVMMSMEKLVRDK